MLLGLFRTEGVYRLQYYQPHVGGVIEIGLANEIHLGASTFIGIDNFGIIHLWGLRKVLCGLP